VENTVDTSQNDVRTEDLLRAAEAGDDKVARDLSRKQQKALENWNKQTVSRGELPKLLGSLMGPTMGRIVAQQQETNLALLTLSELLIEKGILTTEEIKAKEEEIVARISKAHAEQLVAEQRAEREDAAAESPDEETAAVSATEE
jgi:hypothetical protein